MCHVNTSLRNILFLLQSDKSYHLVKISDSDSDDEVLKEPPPGNLVYHRSWRDRLKLIILPPVYFAFIVVAAIVAFFSIKALVTSYKHRVRSFQYISLETYHTIGIAMFIDDFAIFDYCNFIYQDDLHPEKSTKLPGPINCTYENVTFFSRALQRNRTAMVFNGPTLVRLKQSLAVQLTVDTTTHSYSAIEYMLMDHWHEVQEKSVQEQAAYLAYVEQKVPLYSLPVGFRCWVKMSYTVYNVGTKNESEFNVHSDLASHNDWRNISERTDRPILALYEWKKDTYEYVTDILSTNVWNTLGALAGVFITLIKVGDFTNRWIKRIHREKKKKLLKIAEIEEQHRKKLDQHWRRKMERQLKRLSN